MKKLTLAVFIFPSWSSRMKHGQSASTRGNTSGPAASGTGSSAFPGPSGSSDTSGSSAAWRSSSDTRGATGDSRTPGAPQVADQRYINQPLMQI